jgi:phosphoglycerate dehydrogenase-like enzyme
MELDGRSLGIVGLGASGRQLAHRARAFGMRILAIDIRPIEEDVLAKLQPEFIGDAADLDQVVADCDFLSLHLPLTASTRHTLDARRIGLMKPTACVINVARGALVDEQALHQALLEQRIGGAGLDAFADEPPDPSRPVYQLPNVYVTPHIAGSTDGTSRKRAAFAADNLDRYARNEEIVARVM